MNIGELMKRTNMSLFRVYMFVGICISLLHVIDSNPIWETTRYGTICKNKCNYYNEDYTWCFKRSGGWDYCSKYAGITRYGDVCKTECAKNGANYYWCHIDTNNNWEYCSVPIARSTKTTAFYNSYCLDECAYRGSSYRWCHTNSDWDYCSQSHSLAASDRSCTGDCRYNGYNYQYCYIWGGGWHYCSIPDDSPTVISEHENRVCSTPCKDSKCRVFHPVYDRTEYNCNAHDPNKWIQDLSCVDSIRRQVDQCRIVTDSGNNRIVVWTRAGGNIVTNPTRQQERATTDIIAQLNSVPGGNAGTIITSNLMRIDLQGTTSDGFLNIQVQINGPRRPGQSTSTAGILIRQNDALPIRYIRNGLVSSLREQCMIRIERRPM